MEDQLEESGTTSRQASVSCAFCGALNRVDLARLDDGPKCGGCGRPLLLDRPQPVAGEALERIVQETSVPVLIDFHADWCGPCRIMAPVLDDLARDRAGAVLVGKLDTDRYPAAAVRHGVRGIPTLILFAGGREVARHVGMLPRSGLDAMLELASAPVKAGS